VLANFSVKNVSVTQWFCLQCSCKKCLWPCDSAGFSALHYMLFCLFLSTCVLQSVCVHTMDFVSAHKQIKEKEKSQIPQQANYIKHMFW